jgi:hypothetical protein
MSPYHDCEYRIEADKLLSEYDALELDAGIMLAALRAISDARPNKRFDPWARGVAQDAIWNVSERTRVLRPSTSPGKDRP